MTTSNCGSNNGSHCGSSYGSGSNDNSSNWSSGTSTSGTTGTGNATATCTELTTGTTLSVNEITSPGCYVCNWNGSLLRVGESCFSSSGFTAFNFTCTEPLTCTYLSDDPTASLEDCRTWANSSNTYCNF